ncbi:MAG: MarR family winged helix-turn-helix transcriptional regulator [Silicimonas sp.]|nr:MarR family winged helix-turn-helix transcriptional regulator [Silicimonas sp.]NND21145.1 winged helix-turn-helix transcriptional regulator [Silicimonas sp.]NND43561.1 winged helix-turn-helix transcriptional regulator [Silicimonas sp.]NNF91946.1 winged helix-turn-helix transcriptional regulator [Boseongicola sp.]
MNALRLFARESRRIICCICNEVNITVEKPTEIIASSNEPIAAGAPLSDDLPVFDLNGFVPYQVSVVAHDLSQGLADDYRRRFGITIPEWRVLVNVGYSDKVSVRDIQKRVRLEKSKVSRAATRLEAAGYLTKRIDPDDRRLLHLELTDKGRALLAEIVPIAKAYQERLTRVLGPDMAALRRSLDILMTARDL